MVVFYFDRFLLSFDLLFILINFLLLTLWYQIDDFVILNLIGFHCYFESLLALQYLLGTFVDESVLFPSEEASGLSCLLAAPGEYALRLIDIKKWPDNLWTDVVWYLLCEVRSHACHSIKAWKIYGLMKLVFVQLDNAVI